MDDKVKEKVFEKIELIFQSIIDEYYEKIEKSKNRKILKISFEDKIHQTFRRLISKSCHTHFEKIYDTYIDALEKLIN